MDLVFKFSSWERNQILRDMWWIFFFISFDFQRYGSLTVSASAYYLDDDKRFGFFYSLMYILMKIIMCWMRKWSSRWVNLSVLLWQAWWVFCPKTYKEARFLQWDIYGLCFNYIFCSRRTYIGYFAIDWVLKMWDW